MSAQKVPTPSHEHSALREQLRPNEAIDATVKSRRVVLGTFLSDLMLLSFPSMNLFLSYLSVHHMGQSKHGRWRSTTAVEFPQFGSSLACEFLVAKTSTTVQLLVPTPVESPATPVLFMEPKNCGWFLLKTIGPNHKGH